MLKFPGGLLDFLKSEIGASNTVNSRDFAGRTENRDGKGAVEWAVAWTPAIDPFVRSYCNTIPTPQGGTHEQGLRNALTKALRAHGERANNRKTGLITADDVMTGACAVLSVFIREPEFQGQTKDKLSSPDAQRLVESVVRDHFDHWLAESPAEADRLLDFVIDQAEDRLKKTPGKRSLAQGRDPQAAPSRQVGRLHPRRGGGHRDIPGRRRFRRRQRQAGARPRHPGDPAAPGQDPQRGQRRCKASCSRTRNCPIWCRRWAAARAPNTSEQDLRYERVIVMTDADVDGAHIASLLLTFFYREMPELIAGGHLFLAMPPLYRLAQGAKTIYARDDADRDRLLKNEFRANAKVEISRFKGLGEMMPQQLKRNHHAARATAP